jgi:DNA-binding transcriptional LysR family regulator
MPPTEVALATKPLAEVAAQVVSRATPREAQPPGRRFLTRTALRTTDGVPPLVQIVRQTFQGQGGATCSEGALFLPRMCAGGNDARGISGSERGELHVERKIRLVYPAKRALSHAARAFLGLVKAA